ncbi:MAG: DNA-binding protein [Desulfobulbus propionicus]|nr:MAG: DNA-binding protein [Desulfobulbus propionicus]
MKRLMTTREVADFLNVNEKMVYSLVSEKELPATKITGKWLFPRHLIEKWVENNTINFPGHLQRLPPYHGILILAGSNDLLLDGLIGLFNKTKHDQLAVFGNLGSMGGIHALRQGFCHIASSHLVQDDDREYNFDFASQEFPSLPVVVNFCKRRQGLLVAPGNPLRIKGIADLKRESIQLVNRHLGTGTRLLLDRELARVGIRGDKIAGYSHEVERHLDVGLEILAGRADVGPGIEAVAGRLGLDFLPLRWERFDLLISRDRFFDEGVQRFLGQMKTEEFSALADDLRGYDTKLAGTMVFQGNEETVISGDADRDEPPTGLI